MRERIKPIPVSTPTPRQRVRKPVSISSGKVSNPDIAFEHAAKRNSRGQFGVGNRLWRFTNPGRPRIFETPEALWAKACEYFEYQEANPWQEERIASDRGEPIHISVDKCVPFTLEGFRLFSNITDACWHAYTQRPEFTKVCKQVMEVIRNQKFAGAAAGFFNHAIIARDLGLADKKELTGVDNTPLIPPEQGDNRAKNMRAMMLAALAVDADSNGEEGA